MMVGQRPEPISEALGLHLVTSPLILGEYDAVLVEAMTRWLGRGFRKCGCSAQASISGNRLDFRGENK
jgi:hypothetical protein